MLLQIAFDFYDAANDDVISELDLFKVFQQYASGGRGTRDQFDHYMHKDIVTMTKLLKYLKDKHLAEMAAKEKAGELRSVEPQIRERSTEWRHVITADPEYAYHKKMLFQVSEPAKRKQFGASQPAEFKRNNDPWVQKFIMN